MTDLWYDRYNGEVIVAFKRLERARKNNELVPSEETSWRHAGYKLGYKLADRK